jgi:hypothetical protein
MKFEDRKKWLRKLEGEGGETELLKERFSRWFNKQNSRRETLWMDRFKSVLVDGEAALATMAASIDLNPVRAGIVEDPMLYEWSGGSIPGNPGAKEGAKSAIAVRWRRWPFCDAGMKDLRRCSVVLWWVNRLASKMGPSHFLRRSIMAFAEASPTRT